MRGALDALRDEAQPTLPPLEEAREALSALKEDGISTTLAQKPLPFDLNPLWIRSKVPGAPGSPQGTLKDLPGTPQGPPGTFPEVKKTPY